MSYHEKPKRKIQEPENEAYEIAREFYWRLFVQLMIPALLLSFIFGTLVLLFNHLPDQLNAQCRVFEGDVGIRIISETQVTNITTYYWSDNQGDSWHIVHSVERPYQTAQADCSTVTFSENTITIFIDSQTITITSDGELFAE